MLAMVRLLAAAAMTMALAAQERGSLLVATEASRDPDFARSVVLVIEHDAHHASGLMVNRPTRIALAEALGAGRDTVWAGGPVLLGVNALVRVKAAPAGADRVLPGIYLITDKRRMRAELAAGHPMRVYVGMCGWGGGQLEGEVRRGLWRAVPGSAALVFDPDPGTLWRRLSAGSLH